MDARVRRLTRTVSIWQNCLEVLSGKIINRTIKDIDLFKASEGGIVNCNVELIQVQGRQLCHHFCLRSVKGCIIKGKNLLRLEANYFLSEYIPFSKAGG